jgi:four helix bundle protein
MNRFKDLKIWQAAVELSVEVYQSTASFPREEVYGLTSQIRRCAVSIASNIAEGSGRAGDKEFLQFLSIASGSASELETQLIIAGHLGYIETETITRICSQIEHIQNMNFKLQSTMKARIREKNN